MKGVRTEGVGVKETRIPREERKKERKKEEENRMKRVVLELENRVKGKGVKKRTKKKDK